MKPARMHDFDGMVGQIYDAAVEPGRWPQVLETLSDFLEGAATKLTFQNARTLRSEASSVRMPPEADLTYAQYYYKTNVFLPRIARLRAGALIPVWDLLPREVYQRSEFYNDFCRPGDMCHPIGVVLANERDMRVVFTCGRSRTAGEFEPEHLDRLRRVGPHLVRAASVGLRLSRSEIARSANVEALDRVAQGVQIVAANSEILFANRAAEALLTEADGIRIEKSALRANKQADAAQFRRLIATAAERLDASGGVMALARPLPRRPLSVLVAPLKNRVDMVRARPPSRDRVRGRSGQSTADHAGPVARSLRADPGRGGRGHRDHPWRRASGGRRRARHQLDQGAHPPAARVRKDGNTAAGGAGAPHRGEWRLPPTIARSQRGSPKQVARASERHRMHADPGV